MKSLNEAQLELKKLREEMASNRNTIKMLCNGPTSLKLDGKNTATFGDSVYRINATAKEQKKLGEKEMQLELLIEEERVKEVVREYEELHPQVYESCPICLDDIRTVSSADVYSPFVCCGNWTCKQCSDNCFCTGKVRKCPLCRETIPASQKEYNQGLMRCAKKGQPWAIYQLGHKYERGQIGGRVNMKKAFEQYKLSSELGHAPANIALAVLFSNGVPGVVNESLVKSREYMQKAADMGSFHAQSNLSSMLYKGQGGKRDKAEAARYATLARYYWNKAGKNQSAEAAKGQDTPNCILGFIFFEGEGLQYSANLSKHYLAAGLKFNPSSFNGGAALNYGGAILHQAEELYGRNLSGFSATIQSVYWARKAMSFGHENAKEIVCKMESNELGKCAACQLPEAFFPDKKFLRCGRCRIYYFCSKSCQKTHWESGHKHDCKTSFSLDG